MVKTSVLVQKPLIERMEAIAKANERTLSQEIRLAMRRHAKAQESEVA